MLLPFKINTKNIMLRVAQAQHFGTFGTYAGVRIDPKSIKELSAWAQENNIANPVKPETMHVTVTYSRKIIPYQSLNNINKQAKIIGLKKFGRSLVALLDSPFLHDRWRYGRNLGATWDYPEYIPHITLSENSNLTEADLAKLPLPNTIIRLIEEYTEPLNFKEANAPPDFDISSLWELSNNKLKMALAQLTGSDAVRILQNVGILTDTVESLKASYRKWILKNHPDVGGDLRLTQVVNAAYNYIKQHGLSQERRTAPEDFSADVPIWAWAGYSGGMPPNAHIYRNDYTDINYIKKHLWEVGGQPPYSKEYEWTIWGYDGSYFRNIVTVLASITKGGRKVIEEMAHAMYTWQTKGGDSYPCRAIFVTHNRKFYLIYLDDKMILPPLQMEHKSFNPSNDQQFMRDLPGKLDEISGKTAKIKIYQQESGIWIYWVYDRRGNYQKFGPSRFNDIDAAARDLSKWNQLHLTSEVKIVLAGEVGRADCYLIWLNGAPIKPEKLSQGLSSTKEPMDIVHYLLIRGKYNKATTVETAQRGRSNPNTVLSAIKALVTFIRTYDEAWPSQEVANDLVNWVQEGTAFFQKYRVPMRSVNNVTQMILNQEWDKDNKQLMERWNVPLEKIGRALRTEKRNIEHDLGVSKPLRQLLHYIDIYLTTQHPERSQNNYKNIWRSISLLNDPKITRDWATVETTQEAPNFGEEQSAIADQLARIVQNITGRPGYTLGVDLEQQLGKETGQRKQLYEEYKHIRLAARNIWRRALDYIIRISGKSYIDYTEARKQLLQMGLKYVPMPSGFVGNIGFHEGKVVLYTKEGQAIQGGFWSRPDATISMNPDYDPETEDNIYVARLHHPSFQNPQPLYTFQGIKSGRVAKWDYVQKDLESIREFESRWERDVNNSNPRIWLQALMTYFLYQTAARVGSQGNRARGVDTYGLSTCLVKHLHISGNTYIFDYVGKDAIDQEQTCDSDGNMQARIRKRMLELLQGKKPDNLVFTIGNVGCNSNTVAAYMRSIGMASSAHGMRYMRGTLLAKEILKSSNWKPDPNLRVSEEKQAKDFIYNTIAIPVAKLLGHKKGSGEVLATTCLKSYIDPNLFKDQFAKWHLLYPEYLPEI